LILGIIPWYVAGVLNKGRNGEGNEPREAFPDTGELMLKVAPDLTSESVKS